eukprot:m51a1_g13333 hypothetical protein (466) ;mRNA; f:847-2244
MPTGHFVRDLGAVGDKDSESEAILIQHDIPYNPFSQDVLACLPPLPWAFEAARDLPAYRRDLRDRRICSIDPPGCVDIDDALHAMPLPNGNIEVGVHIADVSHFVREGTPLDAEAAKRCTTVYLADRRIDMLPKPLTEDICSLRSGVDRVAFSVLWEMTPDARVVRTDFCKSAIRSVHSYSYPEAQAVIDDAARGDDVALDLRRMMALSKRLRARRIEAGALVLASAEVRFSKDDKHQPVDIELYELRDTNAMVEEFMLLANIAVAAKIHAHFPHCAVLRRHPAPDPRSFESLNALLRPRGFELSTESSRALALSLDRVADPSDAFVNKLVRMLATRCMNQAVYFSSGTVAAPEFHHYGLATDIYTHFTSPIRRYADVLVHRLLACALGVEPLGAACTKQSVQALCDVMNTRHTMAQYASRSSSELHTTLLFTGKTLTEKGYVTRLRANGFFVFVPKVRRAPRVN